MGEEQLRLEIDALVERLGETLVSRRLTITTAESCTGGLLAATLVDYPGISACLYEAHVTYANEAKVTYCAVKEETLAAHGAVSAETAREMAEGLRAKTGADIALSTTGIAGPGGGTKEKPVGLVYVACASKHGTGIEKLNLAGTRREVREQTVRHALEMALEAALKYE